MNILYIHLCVEYMLLGYHLVHSQACGQGSIELREEDQAETKHCQNKIRVTCYCLSVLEGAVTTVLITYYLPLFCDLFSSCFPPVFGTNNGILTFL